MSLPSAARWGLAIFGAIGLLATPVHAGTWTDVVNSAPLTPSFTQTPTTMQLLSDGRVLVGDGGTGWVILSPTSDGKYENGTWTEVASSHASRSLFPSTMLKDGRYLIVGGEHIGGPDPSALEIYDPVTDTWTSGPDMPAPVLDAPASILPDGKFIVGSKQKPDVYIYNPTTNAWTKSANPIGTGGSGSEKGWTLIQNGKVLDAFTTWSLYNPATDQWTTAANLPVSLTAPSEDGGLEIGPMSLLHSGKVIQFGAAAGKGHTAIFDPSNNTWTAGPDSPDAFQFGDSPAAVMPNGSVLCTTTADLGGGGDTKGYWTYTPSTNSFIAQPAPSFGLVRALFLVLPTGQVLTLGADTHGRFALFAAATGSPQSSWRPTVTSITSPTSGEFTLNGTQLNGLTTGASYGDDNNMATNFPIVSLAAGTQKFYARSYGFSQMTPQVGATGSCKFTLPTSIPNGTYTVRVSANGVESTTSASLTVSGQHVTQLTGGITNAAPGTTTTWTVSVATAAPTGGTVVNLTSSDTNVATVPASVTVAQGMTSATFTLTSRGLGRAFISAVTATANPQFKAAQRAFGWLVSSVRADAGSPIFAVKVTISNDAPAGGVTFNLSSNVPLGGSLPPTATIPVGSQRTVSVSGINPTINPGLVTITASLLNSSQFGYLTDQVTHVDDKRWAWMHALPWPWY